MVKNCREVWICWNLVGADAHIGPLGSYEFAIDFRKNGAICRVDVSIDPYEAFTRNARNFEQFSKFRGKDSRKPGRFSWSVQGTPGGIEIPPGSFSFPSLFFWRSKRKD